MNTRSNVAELIRELDPDLAEAIEERLFDDAELADMARTSAFDHPNVSNAFFAYLRAASALEELED